MKLFDKDIIFGTYFLGEWIEELDVNDIQEALQLIQKNPFKQITKMVKTAVNTSNEINEIEERLTDFTASLLVDKFGGVNGAESEKFLNKFSESIKVQSKGKKKAGAK